MFCHAFYQEDLFYAVSHGHINILSPKFTINKYIALFITTLLNFERFRYPPFGRSLYKGDTEKMNIYLPVKQNDDKTPILDDDFKYSNEGYIPDFQFMEDYIKSLPFSCNI